MLGKQKHVSNILWLQYLIYTWSQIELNEENTHDRYLRKELYRWYTIHTSHTNKWWPLTFMTTGWMVAPSSKHPFLNIKTPVLLIQVPVCQSTKSNSLSFTLEAKMSLNSTSRNAHMQRDVIHCIEVPYFKHRYHLASCVHKELCWTFITTHTIRVGNVGIFKSTPVSGYRRTHFSRVASFLEERILWKKFQWCWPGACTCMHSCNKLGIRCWGNRMPQAKLVASQSTRDWWRRDSFPD